RLTTYPEFTRDPVRWIHPDVRFAVLDRSDAEGLGRDDPGAVFPEKVQGTREVDDGAEVVGVGEAATQWYSGADTAPVVLAARFVPLRGRAREILDGVRAGPEPGEADIVALFATRGPEVAGIGEAADDLRRQVGGDEVTWVANRNI